MYLKLGSMRTNPHSTSRITAYSDRGPPRRTRPLSRPLGSPPCPCLLSSHPQQLASPVAPSQLFLNLLSSIDGLEFTSPTRITSQTGRLREILEDVQTDFGDSCWRILFISSFLASRFPLVGAHHLIISLHSFRHFVISRISLVSDFSYSCLHFYLCMT